MFTQNKSTFNAVLILGALIVTMEPCWAEIDQHLFNVNNVALYHSNNGYLVDHHPTQGAGLEWPKGSNKHAAYTSGLWIVAVGEDSIRTATAEIESEFIPGSYGSNPDSSIYRIYSITSDDQGGGNDWLEWPVEQGAPWVDLDQNGQWDPTVDQPDFKGDLFSWSLMNDGLESLHQELRGTDPIGVEVRSSVFGYGSDSLLNNVVFYTWDIINRSNINYEELLIGLWADPQIGDRRNDLVGCNPNKGYAFSYNQARIDEIYGAEVPALGYVMLDSPDTTFRFMPLFSSWDSTYNEPVTPTQIERSIRGANTNPLTGEHQTYAFNGDPIYHTGWNMADFFSSREGVRFVLGARAQHFAPGDSIQVSAAVVLAEGYSHLGSLAALYDEIDMIRELWNEDFHNLEEIVRITELTDHTNTESKGPFTFQFNINDSMGKLSQSRYLNVEFQGNTSQYPLVQVENDIWEVTVPITIGNTVERLEYWISYLENSDPSRNHFWPSGAPYNRKFFNFGPDLVKPILKNLTDIQDIHYRLPVSKGVEVDITDDRHGIGEVWLNWYYGGIGPQWSKMICIDTSVINLVTHYLYSGRIEVFSLPDNEKIFYAARTIDKSENQNRGGTEAKWFNTGKTEILGNWDYFQGIEMQENWEWFDQGEFKSYSSLGSGWRSVIQLNMTSPEAIADTMTYLRNIRLLNCRDAYLIVPMATNILDSSGYVNLEFYYDKDWHVRDTYTGYTPPKEYIYSLDRYQDLDFKFRFVSHRDSLTLTCAIDDLVFTTINPNPVGLAGEITPKNVYLSKNYPNPFNPSTKIEYKIPAQSDVSLIVYDVSGREVQTLVTRSQAPGSYQVSWDGINSEGKQVSGGMYFARLQAGEYSSVIKMVYLK